VASSLVDSNSATSVMLCGSIDMSYSPFLYHVEV
jgi:hypothetical protein